jgi:hypothetical protein
MNAGKRNRECTSHERGPGESNGELALRFAAFLFHNVWLPIAGIWATTS